MRRTIAHKKLTVVIGIMVAVIIAITLWANGSTEASSHLTPSFRKEILLPVPGKNVISSLKDIYSFTN